MERATTSLSKHRLTPTNSLKPNAHNSNSPKWRRRAAPSTSSTFAKPCVDRLPFERTRICCARGSYVRPPLTGIDPNGFVPTFHGNLYENVSPLCGVTRCARSILSCLARVACPHVGSACRRITSLVPFSAFPRGVCSLFVAMREDVLWMVYNDY